MNNEKFYIIKNETTGKEIGIRNNFAEIFDEIYNCCYDFIQNCNDWQSLECVEIENATIGNQALWLAAQIIQDRSGGDVCSIYTAKVEKEKLIL